MEKLILLETIAVMFIVYPQVFELIREKLIYFLHQIHNDNNTPATRNIKLI